MIKSPNSGGLIISVKHFLKIPPIFFNLFINSGQKQIPIGLFIH